MSLKTKVLGEDTEGPANLDRVAVTKNIVLHLYKEGKYEQWCLDYRKDRDAYFQDVIGQNYSDFKARNPVPQPLREQPRKKGLMGRLFK